MAASNKHTVYVDVDDEITAIIDKVKTSPDKIVALVLPKRATVLQSIVNMKLLKKSAAASNKSLVLITSEAGLMPLAGAVGIHVAKSLQSKPVIPLAPLNDESELTEITESGEEPPLDKDKSVGEHALAAGEAAEDETETIELDDVNVDDEKIGKKPGGKAKQIFKVPNFDRFRLGFFLAILSVILLIAGWIFAAIVLPSATVAIDTDSSTIVSNVPFTANTAFNDLNLEKAEVPAVLKEVKKTDSETVTATGKKDTGSKAGGTMTLTNCINDGASHTIPAGTAFSSGNFTFLTNEAVTLEPALFSGLNCKSATFGLSKEVGVTASKGGADHNISARSYESSISGIRASGSDMSGGTTNLVTVVGQSDLESATAKMKGRLDAGAKQDLMNLMKAEELKVLDESFVVSEPVISSTPVLNAESEEVTVKAETTYTLLGVKELYLSKLIKKDAETKIDKTKQSILDDGLDEAPIRTDNKKSGTEMQMTVQALVIAGPQLDAEKIKEEIKGKKRGEVERIISSKTGVRDVTITYKPFWVLSTPKSVKKINIIIEKPDTTKATSNGSAQIP